MCTPDKNCAGCAGEELGAVLLEGGLRCDSHVSFERVQMTRGLNAQRFAPAKGFLEHGAVLSGEAFRRIFIPRWMKLAQRRSLESAQSFEGRFNLFA